MVAEPQDAAHVAGIVESRDREGADVGAVPDRLEQGLHALAGGLARVERKLDRILALAVELRLRQGPDRRA